MELPKPPPHRLRDSLTGISWNADEPTPRVVVWAGRKLAFAFAFLIASVTFVLIAAVVVR